MSNSGSYRKRGRDENESEDPLSPQAKKRKITPDQTPQKNNALISENGGHSSPNGEQEAEVQHEPEEEEEQEEKEDDNYWIPSQICITGYDKPTTAKFEGYANALNIELNKKWSIGSTDMLISKSIITNNKPQITFKVLASILCNIPVVRENFLENSFEQKKILDHRKFICNYRRVGNQGLFSKYSILFATTNMPTERLRTLLTLGKAKVLETKEQINNKDKSLFDTRIMICAHETEPHQAKQLSEEYNCRVISESWVIKCIYPDNDINDNSLCLTKKQKGPIINYYEQEPIMFAKNLDEFDQTIKGWDDEESSSDDEEEQSESQSESHSQSQSQMTEDQDDDKGHEEDTSESAE